MSGGDVAGVTARQISAAADRGDDVEPRLRRQHRVEPGALRIDVDVDVRSQLGPGRAQAVAQSRPARVELGDRAADGGGVDGDAPGQVAEERRQGGGEMHLGHYGITATSTEEIAGR